MRESKVKAKENKTEKDNNNKNTTLLFPKLSKEDALKESEKEIEQLKSQDKENDKGVGNESLNHKGTGNEVLPFQRVSKEEALQEMEKEVQEVKAKDKAKEKEVVEIVEDENGEGSSPMEIGGSPITSPIAKTLMADEKKASPLLTKEERQKLKEEKEQQKVARMKEVEEKRKKREEEKLMKQVEKEKRENERKERERLKEEERKAREEKKEEERKQKEEERKQREEEKQKKDEQLRLEKEKKEAEREKKEQERKLKEEAKRLEDEKRKQEEEALRKKKEKEANHFKSFFTKKKEKSRECSSKPASPIVECHPRFKPFQLKQNMTIAPLIRCENFKKAPLDSVLEKEDLERTTYLNEQTKKFQLHGKPKYISRRKNRRESEEQFKLEVARKKESQKKTRPNAKSNTSPTNKIDVQQVVVINDDSNDALDEDTEEEGDSPPCNANNLYIAKLLQFSDNTRPAYYGTWRKKTKHVSGRKPFGRDADTFNYDVDSDEDWIDEPGESLSGDDDDEKEKEDDQDIEMDEEDGFFVPHGYLSDDEGVADVGDSDEETTGDGDAPSGSADLHADRKLKLKALALENDFNQTGRQRKSVCIGITYTHNVDNMVLRNYGKVRLMKPVREKEIIENNEDEEMDTSTSSPASTPKGNWENGYKIPLTVPEEAMPMLIRFVHGNVLSLPNMLPKFRDYWVKYVEVNGGHLRGVISKRQLERKIQTIASRIPNAEVGKTCYTVSDDILKKYGLTDIKIGEGLPDLIPDVATTTTAEPERPESVEDVMEIN